MSEIKINKVEKITVIEKIKAGEYENKLPYSPATVNLSKNIAYENEEKRLFDNFRKDLQDETGKSTNEIFNTGNYMQMYNDFIA